jgi:hypothetical protein
MTLVVSRGGLFGLALLAGGLFPVRPAAAQQPDLLKETQQRLQIEAERLERVVAAALNDSDAVGRTNPMRALAILKEAKSQIEADKEALKPERREALGRKITLAMRAWGERADNPTVVTPGPGPGTTRVNAEAKKQAEELRRMRDDIAHQYASGKDTIAARRELNRLIADRRVQLDLDVMKTMVPPIGDIEFPKDWVEKSKRRTTAIQLTETEKQIIKALNTPMTIEVEGKTLKEVLDDLRERTKMPIVVDQRALDDLNITYNSPVNLNLRNVTTRTVLKRLTADLQLTYVMKDQTIQITTPARAKEMLSVRVYSVADLMSLAQPGTPAIFAQAQAYQTLQMLVTLITQTVEPDKNEWM